MGIARRRRKNHRTTDRLLGVLVSVMTRPPTKKTSRPKSRRQSLRVLGYLQVSLVPFRGEL